MWVDHKWVPTFPNARYVDKPVLVIGTHFAPPTAGYIVPDGDRYKLKI